MPKYIICTAVNPYDAKALLSTVDGIKGEVIANDVLSSMHPATQARWIESRVSIGEGFVTWSVNCESAIIRLCEMVEAGDLSPDDVEIVVDHGGITASCRPGQDGVLNGDWPVGFFLAEPRQHKDGVGVPAYDHDCSSCTFLGQSAHDGTLYDLYYHGTGTAPTVIGRFSSKGEEYMSGLWSTLPVLMEAKRRAIARGVLTVQKLRAWGIMPASIPGHEHEDANGQ